jgi:galactokinase
LNLDDLTLAKLAQSAEIMVGVQCGIMDQMAVSLGEYGHALFIDTQNFSYQKIPIPFEFQFVAIDSGIPRSLAKSSYNERRRECEESARMMGILSLRQFHPSLSSALQAVPQPFQKRARHVVKENQRVLEGVSALSQKDYATFGRLMLESHKSLRDDFEVSLKELDHLVEIAIKHGATGARLTGAGFGGCLVAMVKKDLYSGWKSAMLKDCPGVRFVE